MNKFKIKYAKTDLGRGECEITLSKNLTDVIDLHKEFFEIEILEGDTIETDKDITFKFKSSLEKLKILETSLTQAYYDYIRVTPSDS